LPKRCCGAGLAGKALPTGPVQTAGGNGEKASGGHPRTLHSGLNNGFAEAINGCVQAAKAYDEQLITVSYLVCGKLKHFPKNPSKKSWLHRTQQTSA
jgi:hypothetical protein